MYDDEVTERQNYLKKLIPARAKKWDCTEVEARMRMGQIWMINREKARERGDERAVKNLTKWLRYLD